MGSVDTLQQRLVWYVGEAVMVLSVSGRGVRSRELIKSLRSIARAPHVSKELGGIVSRELALLAASLEMVSGRR